MNKIKRKFLSTIIIILSLFVFVPALFADNPNAKPQARRITRHRIQVQRAEFERKAIFRRLKIGKLCRHRRNRFLRRYAYLETQRERYLRRNHCQYQRPITP
ncbi:MAG: hypothetical protein ABIK61_00055 [candidate division WOR-3 bacterium]